MKWFKQNERCVTVFVMLLFMVIGGITGAIAYYDRWLG